MSEQHSRRQVLKEALAIILQAIVESVYASGGSPSSIVCLTMQTTFGVSTGVYCQIEDHLVTLKILKRENHYLTVNAEVARSRKLLA